MALNLPGHERCACHPIGSPPAGLSRRLKPFSVTTRFSVWAGVGVIVRLLGCGAALEAQPACGQHGIQHGPCFCAFGVCMGPTCP